MAGGGNGRLVVALYSAGVVAAALAGWILSPKSEPPDLAKQLGIPHNNESGATGVLLLHPKDCASAWRFLSLLLRPIPARLYPLRTIYLTADSTDGSWRAELPPALRRLAAIRVSSAAARSLAPLAVRATPALLVFRGGRLALVERAPTEPRAFIQLGRRLEGRAPLH